MVMGPDSRYWKRLSGVKALRTLVGGNKVVDFIIGFGGRCIVILWGFRVGVYFFIV